MQQLSLLDSLFGRMMKLKNLVRSGKNTSEEYYQLLEIEAEYYSLRDKLFSATK